MMLIPGNLYRWLPKPARLRIQPEEYNVDRSGTGITLNPGSIVMILEVKPFFATRAVLVRLLYKDQPGYLIIRKPDVSFEPCQ